jgi:hypothetical protein
MQTFEEFYASVTGGKSLAGDFCETRALPRVLTSAKAPE